MDRAGRQAILAAGVLTVIAAATWRAKPGARDVPRNRTEREAASQARPPAAMVAEAPVPGGDAPPQESIESLMSQFRQGGHPSLPKDVLSGPLGIEGSGGTSLEMPDLPLSASQRTLVEALLRERNAALEAIRREAEAAPQAREAAGRLSARADEIHARCLSSIRECLLPDQRGAFEDLVRTNRWGRYVLVIPTRP